MENYYELLEVSKNASDEVISKVFKHHIKKNHPDLFTGKEKIEAEIKVKKLNEAYEVLSNPRKRGEYDQKLAEEENIKNNIKDEEINELNIEKNKLLHSINNYNRFINEYFYEKADDVLDIIKSYDAENNSNFKYNEISIKEKIKKYCMRAVVYIVGTIVFFTLISILFRVNVFSIFFNVLKK